MPPSDGAESLDLILGQDSEGHGAGQTDYACLLYPTVQVFILTLVKLSIIWVFHEVVPVGVFT